MSNSNIKNDFQTFLIKQGYKTLTPSGNKSTVYDYIKRIDFVCEIEKYNWKNLGDNIDQILYDYGPSGIKANLGAKSHNAVISAIKFLQKIKIVRNPHISQIKTIFQMKI